MWTTIIEYLDEVLFSSIWMIKLAFNTIEINGTLNLTQNWDSELVALHIVYIVKMT